MKKQRQNIKAKINKIDNYKSFNNKLQLIFSSENIKIVCHLAPYLTYEELISLSNISKSFHKIIRTHKVMKSFIINSKLLPKYRLLFYVTNLDLSQTKLTIKKELSEYNIKDNYYKTILHLSKEAIKTIKNSKKLVMK